MQRAGWLLAAVMIGGTAAPALAQFGSPSYQFLQHVRNEEGKEVEDALRDNSYIINTHDESSGDTALHILARKASCGWLGYFLNNKADPNAQNKGGETPMYVSVVAGADTCVDYLLIMHADPNLGDRQRVTPLILAVQRHDRALVRKLLDAGADPDIRDLTGNSARDYATKDPRNGDVAKIIGESKPKARRQVAGPKLR